MTQKVRSMSLKPWDKLVTKLRQIEDKNKTVTGYGDEKHEHLGKVHFLLWDFNVRILKISLSLKVKNTLNSLFNQNKVIKEVLL